VIATERKIIMDAQYHPFQAALAAAHQELTSEKAQRFYAIKAQKDAQNALDAAITLFAWVYRLAELSYAMGVQCRTWYASENVSQAPALYSKVLTPARTLLALPPAVSPNETHYDGIPDFWDEPLPIVHIPPVVGPIWNPPPTDMHQVVAFLQSLQHVPLLLPPAVEPIAATQKAPKSTKTANARKPKQPSKKATQPKSRAKRSPAKAKQNQ
jgi:hypothetical protein